LIVLAVLGFIYSLKFYDLAEFWGTRQLKERNSSIHDQENFQISPLHRYVRHPWYFFALVIIWSRDFSTVQLLVNVLVSGYFIVGSILEEKKLRAYHGEVYQRYQQQVAGLIPLPWKILSATQARKLLENQN
jgi:protein-S-isoprenylcysteine O-methyltransferase Ste14